MSAFLKTNRYVREALSEREQQCSSFLASPTSSNASTSISAMPVDTIGELMSADHRYSLFRSQMLNQMYASNGGHLIVPNPNMRRNANPSKTLANLEMDQADAHPTTPVQQVATGAASEVQIVSGSDSSSSGANNGLIKDNDYFERRRKNNAAAKKSRDRRRLKEDELAMRSAYLEQENLRLKIELNSMKRQLATFLENR